MRDKLRCRKCGSTYTKSQKTINGEYILKWDFHARLFIDCAGNIKISAPKDIKGSPDKPYILQVHHKKYIINHLPWEYEDDDLITLCNYCHAEVHESEKVPIFDEMVNEFEYETCSKCKGSGYLPHYHYYKAGICFQCNGARINKRLIDKKL